MGLARKFLPAMVSAGSRFNAPIRVGDWAQGNVWKVRAWLERVVDTKRHQHAQTGLWTQHSIIAATNKKPCLAGRA